LRYLYCTNGHHSLTAALSIHYSKEEHEGEDGVDNAAADDDDNDGNDDNEGNDDNDGDDDDDGDDRDDDNDDVLNNISSATDDKIFVLKKQSFITFNPSLNSAHIFTVPLQELVEQVHFQIDHDKIQTEQYLWQPFHHYWWITYFYHSLKHSLMQNQHPLYQE